MALSREIEALAARLIRGAATDGARAVRLHDFVRDRIRFGFAPQLDAATPEDALVAGAAGTIAKTGLFVALLRAAGLRAFQHFVTIDRGLLHGLFPDGAERLLPWEIAHSYADVEIEGRWCRVDSYVLDRDLWRAGVARLRREGGTLGYGVHRSGTCRWAGAGDAFAQLASRDMIVEDHGVLETLPAGAADRARCVAAGPWSSLLACDDEALRHASARRTAEHLDALRRRPALSAAAASR